MSDNSDEIGGVVSTKLRRVRRSLDTRTREISFVVTEEFLEAVADSDEQSSLYLLELMTEMMQELQAYARGTHPYLGREYDDQGIPITDQEDFFGRGFGEQIGNRTASGINAMKQQQGYFERKYKATPEEIKRKDQLKDLIDSLRVAGVWPPQKP